MSERPWWFAIAVPGMVAIWSVFFVADVAVGKDPGRAWIWTDALISVVAAAPLAYRLGRAEDAYRAHVRPAELGRWGSPAVGGDAPALTFSLPVINLLSLSIGFAAILAVKPVLGLVALGLIAVLSPVMFRAADGDPVRYAGVTWLPAIWYRWRATTLMLGIFLFVQTGLAAAVDAARGEVVLQSLFTLTLVSGGTAKLGLLLRNDPRPSITA
ncbi:MAG: hypothetical protein ACRDHF_07310 [Tepidiformaceae bacterium]